MTDLISRWGNVLEWLLLGVVFFAGWAMRGAIADRDLAALQRDLAQQSEQAATAAHQAEGRISDAVLRASGDAIAGERKALDDYARLVACPLPHGVPGTNGEDGHGMPPAAAPAPTAPAKGQCRCPQQDRERLQRLYQRQLAIARDCDITAARYNALLDAYNAARAATGGHNGTANR